MSAPARISACALPPSLAWCSLVERSIKAWKSLYFKADKSLGMNARPHHQPEQMLRSCRSLDELLRRAGDIFMFWFFQRREAFLAQKRLIKWCPDALDEYILLPASPGYLSRRDCFFVSHFWHTTDDPDPDGDYLRQFQASLEPLEWSYIWVDWSCTPQAPRSDVEKQYFVRSLQTVSSIIRNCAFMWFYPPFEARLWILYEVAEFVLTSSGGLPETPDMEEYMKHIREMTQHGVRSVLDKYQYECKYEHDKAFLLSWLEVLVLLRRLRIEITDARLLLDYLTWLPTARRINLGMWLQLDKSNGFLIVNGVPWKFTAFPDVIIETSLSNPQSEPE
ncbi:hypothetical protein LTR37_009442 [Vermiconidia calcicola]|uniref:Uncharacterized protein n=1 Tax=Vermiconidia calcicola TaxID=1690605 RepID=A0ACC3N7Q4_9PEZI|nr:hypothetical protein LTR37_009442 [Vermiconidia calcicola]